MNLSDLLIGSFFFFSWSLSPLEDKPQEGIIVSCSLLYALCLKHEKYLVNPC